MNDKNGYAVFFFPQALEALGDAIKPYLQEGAAGAHVVCREVDTGGALVEMTLDGRTTAGEAIELELMVPTNMVRMIVSARSDEAFGFGPRMAVEAAQPIAAQGGGGAQVEVEAGKAPEGEDASKATPGSATQAQPPESGKQ